MSNICELKNISVDFKIKAGLFKKPDILSAVSNVSFSIEQGETFALVGESGCGKTTIANTILGFIPPTRGEIDFNGYTIKDKMNKNDLRDARKDMQVIFQDPFSSLNPRFSVFDVISEPIKLRGEENIEKLRDRCGELLEKVGLNKTDLDRNIFEFSGGQRQRIAIARALALNPKLIVCDEPTSALDVSVHSQVCNLLMDLQEELDLTYLFISHNLALVKHISKHVAVMYLGQIVEEGLTESVFKNPKHPYTKALLSSVLTIDKTTKLEALGGEATSPINAVKGCRFHSRCPFANEECKEINVELKEVAKEHFCACPYVD